MYLFLHLNLDAGTLCKVVSPNSKFYNEVVRFVRLEFYMQKPYFVFQSEADHRVILDREEDFVTLPNRSHLEYLIGLSLQTKDREWFDQLVYQWKHETQEAGKELFFD